MTKTFLETIVLLTIATALFVAAAMVPAVSLPCIIAGSVFVVGSFIAYEVFADAAMHA